MSDIFLLQAQQLVVDVDDRPEWVALEAPRVAAVALGEANFAAAAIAFRAAGVAERRVANDAERSVEHLREAARLAELAGRGDLVGEALISLSMTLAWCGDTTEALEALDAAEVRVDARSEGRLHAQRATVFQKIGDAGAAEVAYERALDRLDPEIDAVWVAHALANRGILRAYDGRARMGVGDLERACGIYQDLGASYQLASNVHNLGFVLGRAGDLPAALRLFEDADRLFRAQNIPLAELPLDRAEVLLAAGLAEEAQQIAGAVAAELLDSGLLADAAEALLIEAHAALAGGNLDTAIAVAEQAVRSFGVQGRRSWAAMGEYLAIAAKYRRGDEAHGLLARALAVMPTLYRGGQATALGHVGIIAGQLAIAVGNMELAERLLQETSRRGGPRPVELQVQGWLARSLLWEANGDQRKALTAARSGLQAGERARQHFGASDLRAGLSLHLQDLAEHGLRLAVASKRSAMVLRWMDDVRGHSSRPHAVRPDDDLPELDELRAVHASIRTAGPAELPALLRRQADIERAVQRKDRLGVQRGLHQRSVRLKSVRDRLGRSRQLVELAELDGQMVAVVVGRNRCEVVSLGPLDLINEAARRQRRAIDWVLQQEDPSDRWLVREQAASAELDELLVRPLNITAEEIVVVPPTGLYRLAWSCVPSLSNRALTVAPSAASWVSEATTISGLVGSDVLAVAGPGLSLASEEIKVLADQYPTAIKSLGGERATVSDVLRGAESARILHLAAHGHLPLGNGMFAGVDLADGRLMVYDIERLEKAPALVVMSACEAGSPDRKPGEEFLGLAAGFLTAGSKALVAATGSIPDDPIVVELMRRLHGYLADGVSPAIALSLAQQHVADTPRAQVIAASFVCFGADVSGEKPRSSDYRAS